MTHPAGAARLKKRVHDYWRSESCGENHAFAGMLAEQLGAQTRARYQPEPRDQRFLSTCGLFLTIEAART